MDLFLPQKKFPDAENDLIQIGDCITQHLHSTSNLTLWDGKTGIVLFLFLCSKYTGTGRFEEAAGDLLCEITANIPDVHSTGFYDGLTGIGWTIEYLAGNGFIDVDTDELLSELDDAIWRARLHRDIIDASYADLFGYGLYFLARLRSAKKGQNNTSTLLKKQALFFLTEECEKILEYKSDQLVLHPNTTASVAWFLLQVQQLGIHPKKAACALDHLFSSLDRSALIYTDRSDRFLLHQLVCNRQDTTNETQPVNTCFNAIAECCKAALHELVFAPCYKNCTARLLEDVACRPTDENGLHVYSHPSGEYNLSLNKGLAGMGLALLTATKSHIAQNHYHAFS